MKFFVLFITLVGVATPTMSSAQGAPEIPNWGIDEKDYRAWTVSKCAQRSDAFGSSSHLPPAITPEDLSRENCFSILQFTIVAAHYLFAGGLRDDDFGLFKFAPDPEHVEICAYELIPGAVIPPEIEDVILQEVFKPADGSRKLENPKYAPLMKKMIKIQCETYGS